VKLSGPVDKVSRLLVYQHSKSIIFLIIMLAVVGVYRRSRCRSPYSPQPTSRRIIVGVDNGVHAHQTRWKSPSPGSSKNAVNSVP